MKRIFTLIGVLVVAGAIGAAAFFYLTGGEGGSKIERWIGNTIIAILNEYIQPEISYAELDYQAPGTVIITDLKIVSDDTTILAVERLRLELAEIPTPGKPIKIEAIDLTKPQLVFIKPGPNQALIGWKHFINTEAIKEPETVTEGRRLSDVLVLRHVKIDQAQLVYEDKSLDRKMVLPDITFDLNTLPSKEQPAWYTLAGKLQRAPLFTLSIDGKLNIDTFELDFKALALEGAIKPEQYQTFPPTVQQFLAEHEIRGQLRAELKGLFAFDAPSRTNASFLAKMTDTSVTMGNVVLPAKQLLIQARAADENVKVTLETETLGGRVLVNGNVSMVSPFLSHWDWTAGNIRVEETLKAAQQNPPKYAGNISSKGKATARLAHLPESLDGSGAFHLSEGRLMNLPLVTEMRRLLTIHSGGKPDDTDRFDIDEFFIKPNHLHITKMEIASGTTVIKGKGRVFYDMTLDLNVSAGAIDGLADQVGLGDIFKAVNARLLTFDVTGKVGDPTVTPRPLDIR